ncbi:MAG: NAD+ synthase, partial [Rickettsiales bacterium]|nr:NAD+ synthase [Rickettsiales bacterium]
MPNKLTIALAQLNFTVGALEDNKSKMIEAYDRAEARGADLIIFSECSITGYPPEDIVLRPSFQDEAMLVAKHLSEHTKGKNCGLLCGGILRSGDHLYNSALLMHEGEIVHIASKYKLPNYGVFDEYRTFSQGIIPRVYNFKGINLGILICEDIWDSKLSQTLAKQDAHLLITLNASPYEKNKQHIRYKIVKQNVRQSGIPLIYVNQVGGQDELVFEGHSFVMNTKEELSSLLPAWSEHVEYTEWENKTAEGWTCTTNINSSLTADITNPLQDDDESTYHALLTGLRDYINKNGFPGIVIGMSGGIDSALSAAIAVDAIGAENITCVMMPTEFTSEESIKDATECCDMLGVHMETISIQPTLESLRTTLEPFLIEREHDTTDENLQARLRGNILMALSNNTGRMVLTTGNKSEMAVGYATLYGDMCGGYSVLKDLFKSEVIALCRYRNHRFPTLGYGPKTPVIPENIIVKPPTAELRDNQKDSDSLPPYDILDDILRYLIEEQYSQNDIIRKGHGINTVQKIAKLVYFS